MDEKSNPSIDQYPNHEAEFIRLIKLLPEDAKLSLLDQLLSLLAD